MVKVIRPLGARVVVEELITELDVEERARRAGLTAVVYDKNRPRVTSGKVVALGTDPILREAGLVEGITVHFGPHAGNPIVVDGKDYRQLEFQEITLVEENPTTEESPSTNPTGPS